MKSKYFFLLLFLLSFTSIFSQNDCTDAITVCGAAGYSGLTATGVGTQELAGRVTCGSEENNSIWFRLNINTAGTLAFTLKPSSSDITVDFDFFIFGPNVTCGSLGSIIRCSTTNPQASGQANNWTGLNNTATEVSEGPGQLGIGFLKALDVQAGESYFLIVDRPVGDSDFSIEWNGTATFFDPPVMPALTAGATLDIKKCDVDINQNQRTKFDFSANSASIIGTQTNVVLTYHLSENDAIVGINAIPDPTSFENTTPIQTIYFRLITPATGCFITSEFTIEVENFFAIPNDKAHFCDDATDGDDTNGFRRFDMDEVTAKIFDGADTSGLTISYYEDVVDAFPENNPIGQFYTNVTPNEDNIYMKVKNALGCYEIKEIIIYAHPLPAAINPTLVQCDTGLSPDGITLFNLTEADESFTNSVPNLSVSYFLNTTDEANNISLPAQYFNTVNPQNIIARVTNTITGCSRINTLTLSVNVIQAPNAYLPICDSVGSEDGFAQFDLTDSNLNTPPETITFYETVSDALLEQNPILNFTNYQNEVAYNDTVYARIENGNDCAAISTIRLEVYRLPNIDPESDGNDYVCLNSPTEYITIDARLLTGFSTDYTYIWRLNGNIFPQISYSIQVNLPGTYTVEVINKVTACRKIRTIVVKASNEAEVASVEVKDVTVDNNSVTINLTPSSIGNYEYSFANADGPYQASNVFENVPSGIHEFYIRDINGCGLISQTAVIIGLPKFFTPNGDGVNDYWKVDGVNSVFNNTTKIYIFNRDGKLVKEVASRDSTGWDGTLNGKPLPSDDYWYVVYLADGRNVRGHFALKR